jgi:predicted NBD/HSP70 family sugar kinase
VDVGGTFTDVVLVDEHGTTVIHKAFTAPGDEAQGVLDALHKAAEASEKPLYELLATPSGQGCWDADEGRRQLHHARMWRGGYGESSGTVSRGCLRAIFVPTTSAKRGSHRMA